MVHRAPDSRLLIALTAATLALKPATDKRTWGYQRAEIVAAAAQASVLLAVGGFIAVDAVLDGIRREMMEMRERAERGRSEFTA